MRVRVRVKRLKAWVRVRVRRRFRVKGSLRIDVLTSREYVDIFVFILVFNFYDSDVV